MTHGVELCSSQISHLTFKEMSHVLSFQNRGEMIDTPVMSGMDLFPDWIYPEKTKKPILKKWKMVEGGKETLLFVLKHLKALVKRN